MELNEVILSEHLDDDVLQPPHLDLEVLLVQQLDNLQGNYFILELVLVQIVEDSFEERWTILGVEVNILVLYFDV